jgi:uncharacterized 2Fe-2S/4Fe-4S cluster protein (DUF4445 family)
MVNHLVRIDPGSYSVYVPTGTLISEATRLSGVELGQPCGGQGRCGRCIVQVIQGKVRRRSTLRLSQDDIGKGYALACQSLIEEDVTVFIPPQEILERRLTTDRTVAEVTIPDWYYYEYNQTIRRYWLRIHPPNLDDQRDDLSRFLTSFKQQYKISDITVSLSLLKKMSTILREKDWEVTAIVDVPGRNDPEGSKARLIDLIPGFIMDYEPLWGAAIDIGTTTVTVWLVNLISGAVLAQVSEYNGQIKRGEDVISRIVFTEKENGTFELQNLVLTTINSLIETACKRIKDYQVSPADVIKVSVAANSIMTHLFLGIPASHIRLSPFVTVANEISVFTAKEIGLNICPDGLVDCLPGVASYVGSDITAGVLASGMDDASQITLFMDVGTNGEIVLGSREWMVSCACSAGPAFEGAGVVYGMRATTGAIEEVWVNQETYEPEYRVIGGGKPKGICGSGLISLLAELFMTGLIDRAGNLNVNLGSKRIRGNESGLEYVIAWGAETEHGKDITITHVDIDNLIRAKGAIFAGYSVLADSVGVPMDLIEQMLIGGSFGKYINVEKAVQIGLLPDLPWDRFQFLGNTSVRGAYLSLIDQDSRQRIRDIASRMTYVELSADNSFYEAFMSALFLPHTEQNRFPSVFEALNSKAQTLPSS